MYKCEVCGKTVGKRIPSHLLYTYKPSTGHKGYDIASQTKVCRECYEALKDNRKYKPPSSVETFLEGSRW